MNQLAEYRDRCATLRESFLAAKAQGRAVGLQKSTSNLFRRREQAGRRKLDVRSFDHVLHVDPQRMLAEVEGMTTYQILVDETLSYGLRPAVVPQLKTITVGGAVGGLGIESSSFKYGLVHETVEEMDILTGGGAIVRCSRCQNRDLFFGFPNSYGTLGYALRLTIRLLPARSYAYLTHHRFSERDHFFASLEELSDRGAVDFLDGTIFNQGEMYITEAVLVDEAPGVSDYTHMDIYYRSIQRKQEDWLTTKDYLWRWDTDWFWCSKHFGVQNPLLRFLAMPALNSRTYQRIMRLSQKLPADPSHESVIQDVDIPVENAAAFCDFLLMEIGITPVWVCPFTSSQDDFPLCGFQPGRLYINFGFWDTIPTKHEAGHYNKMIEHKAGELEGRKGLYSTAYYDRDTFWNLYDQGRYDALKKTYDPDALFPDLYSKCVERK